jgi:hypothetical protein
MRSALLPMSSVKLSNSSNALYTCSIALFHCLKCCVSFMKFHDFENYINSCGWRFYSAADIQNVRSQMINWKGFLKKQSWCNRNTIPEFARRD